MKSNDDAKPELSRRKAPPIGVLPRWYFEEGHPDPTDQELADRLKEVSAAITRYEIAGLLINPRWLQEVADIHDKLLQCFFIKVQTAHSI